MAFVFCDSKGRIVIDILLNGKTVNREFCAYLLLGLLKLKIFEKRLSFEKKNFLLSRKCTGSLVSNCNLSNRRTSTTDLEKHWVGHKFSSNEEMAVDTYFVGLDELIYKEGIKKYKEEKKHHWNLCIVLRGDYLEK